MLDGGLKLFSMTVFRLRKSFMMADFRHLKTIVRGFISCSVRTNSYLEGDLNEIKM